MQNSKNQKKLKVATISTGVATCVNYTTWAEANVLLGDTDTAANDGKVHVKILGYVNDDGVVDAFDLFDLNGNCGKIC